MRLDQDDPHRSLSPPRTAELLFGLGDVLETQNISATLLAEQIRNTDRSSSVGFTSGRTSTATNEFYSVSSSQPPDLLNSFIVDSGPVVTRPSPPSDILATTFISNCVSDDLSTDSSEPLEQDNGEISTERLQKISENSSNKGNPSNCDTVVNTGADLDDDTSEISEELPDLRSSNVSVLESCDFYTNTKMSIPDNSERVSPDTEPLHVDAAEKVYDAAKGVWSWGKGLVLVSPFLGLAEGLASNVVKVTTGESLDAVDRSITDNIQGLDDKFLNPAITFLLHAVLSVAEKADDVVKPLIVKILAPFGLIKATPQNPELTAVRGVTVTEG